MLKPLFILLADDDGDDRLFFESAYADRSDIQLLPAVVNGVQVIENLKHASSNGSVSPDIIFLDHNMPLMTGKQTLVKIRAEAQYNHIRVCIYSTYPDRQLTQECLRLGAFCVLTKPVNMDEYQAMMDEVVRAYHGSIAVV